VTTTSTAARYRFSDSARAGVLLGMGLRQAAPLVAGMLWLILMLSIGLPALGIGGPVLGAVIAFGRWKHAPLYEVAVPGVRLLAARWRGRRTWTRASLLAVGNGAKEDLPKALRGVTLREVEIDWMPAPCTIGIVTDKTAGALSLVVGVSATGFPVASSSEQDGLVAAWGSALAPIARARCPVARVTWQEWCRPGSTDEHSTFLALGSHERPHASAVADYAELLDGHGAHATAHDVLLTLSLDVRRIRGGSHWNAAVDVLVDEARQLTSRLSAAGFTTTAPLSPSEIADAVRDRSDPSRRHGVSQSLAAAAGRGGLDWGPIAVEPGWFHVRVDDAIHRSYVMAGWPMLPVAADWLGPLLTVDGAIRTVTVVLEPVPLAAAASDANRQLTSIEADLQQKERHGFRLTARERRRHDDVETRERELAEGHPLFRHVGIVTVTALDERSLDDACATVEQAAAQSLVDLRPLAATQAEGWVASLPLGRSVRPGGLR
jgi:hypothetical protein